MLDGRIRSKLSKLSILGCTYFSRSRVQSTLVIGALSDAAAAFSSSSLPTHHQTVNSATAMNHGIRALFSSNYRVFSCFHSPPSSSRVIPDAPSKEFSHKVATDDGDDSGDGDFEGENDNREYDEEYVDFKLLNVNDESLMRNVEIIMDILRGFGDVNRIKVKSKLEQCQIEVSGELVAAILSRTRNDWEAAFTFFVWAGKQPGYAHSVREYHSMISILGKMRKFDTAWALIDEMRAGTYGSSLVTTQTLLIMIRKYCAVHNVGKAISTFHAHRRFGFNIGLEEFQNFLSALCRYKNVKDAEYLLFSNKDLFPFNTKSFNIILNGWCNVIGSIRDAERIWQEMARRGISHDAFSYASIISCYSRARNLYKVLKLFDTMKQMKIDPDRKVYNAVIHALAKGRLEKEAIDLIKTMEEKGIAANVVTYNSIIKPLCKNRKFDEAREVFEELLQRGLCPTIQTYHAFLRFLRTGEEIFELLEKMKRMGCDPNTDTYIMLIRKFCRWRQLDNVSRLWHEMSENGISPDRSSYIVLIHGLFLNGKLEDAYKYYLEMKEKELLPEPKIEEVLQSWLAGKPMIEGYTNNSSKNQLDYSWKDNNSGSFSKKFDQIGFHRQPEVRRVSRDGGFSFWEQ